MNLRIRSFQTLPLLMIMSKNTQYNEQIKTRNFERDQAGLLIHRLKEPRRFIQVVGSARQRGSGIPVDEFLTRLVTHWLQPLKTQ